MSFENLGLNPAILQALNEAGYQTPTPIQQQAIPEVIAGHDLMASAQTGTGKTAAFILPALEKLSRPAEVKSHGPRVLVLTPTRELATQVSDAAAKYGTHMRRVKTVSILGGMPYPLQNKLLSQPLEILVATPGRLLDHIERGRIDFARLEMLVLDEADRMLDMGFIEDVERICAALPTERQTLLFSATLDGRIGDIAGRLLREPKRIQVAAAKARHENIEQRLHVVDDLGHKHRVLEHLLGDIDIKQAIVFTATKRDADELADRLMGQGHAAASLHGDMSQRERNRTLVGMRRGQIRVLVATDVAARGIDVAGISHVINFDLPKQAEDYVHRIGRTGRGGASGIAVSLAAHREQHQVRRIEQFTGHAIPREVIPGLEPRFKPRAKPAPGRGGYAGRPGGNRDFRPAGEERRRDGERAAGPFAPREFRPDARADQRPRKPRPDGNAFPPAREFREAPRRDFREAPRRDFREAPQRDFREAPQRDFREAPQRDFREAPKRDFREAPQRDFRQAPKREFRDDARGNTRGDAAPRRAPRQESGDWHNAPARPRREGGHAAPRKPAGGVRSRFTR